VLSPNRFLSRRCCWRRKGKREDKSSR
jgi:hypothetical protein